jgi:hypothetical protein
MKKIIFTIAFILNLSILYAQWTSINSGIVNGSTNGSYELGVLGTDIYAATITGLYKSTDNGDNWTIVKTGDYITVTIKNNDIYIGGRQGYTSYVSHDTGLTWQSLNTLGSNNSYRSIFVKDSIILCGRVHISGGGIQKSINYGTSWTNSGGFTLTNVIDIAELGTNIFAGGIRSGGTGSRGVYKSTDLGSSFINISPPNLTGVRSLMVHNGVIYAGDADVGRLHFSNDSGATWTLRSTFNNSSMTSLGFLGNTIYAGCGDRIYMSSDSGTTWTNSGNFNSTPYSIAFNNGYIFVGTASTGIWRCSISSINSIEEKRDNNSLFKIFPNPTNSQFTISWDNKTKTNEISIEVTNSLGKIVYSSPFYMLSENIVINLETNPGMFFVTTKDSHGKILNVKKLIVD